MRVAKRALQKFLALFDAKIDQTLRRSIYRHLLACKTKLPLPLRSTRLQNKTPGINYCRAHRDGRVPDKGAAEREDLPPLTA
jgi:hypothetical protein